MMKKVLRVAIELLQAIMVWLFALGVVRCVAYAMDHYCSLQHVMRSVCN